ncbi:TetR/AcrR family transcriptional regulator [Dactylosporangium vinaceum]|uniref:TetR/AcrR family transcriptional regulator n=1 Tax=Dactylosporangium vinaceum TaxID=53362 RepID=A0ABV5ML44_9ACTN|nr:TetR/AcrR family transcriptional regulator [Dactylosporangium vinaceum]UAB94107.1 TetR/AcrR family transcriptional regulator [Dactylosporangium vinaceum]
MTKPTGRRELRKLEMRQRLADAAAQLFAEHGYDAVSISDVATAAGVAVQTVFNYFRTKPDLVLDRADDMLERSRRCVAERDRALTPAEALSVQVHEDIDHFAARDASFARGEFPAQSVESDSLRRFALQFRFDQAEAIAAAIGETDPEIHALVARAHASGLITVMQAVTDRIGEAIRSGAHLATVAAKLHEDAEVTLADAAETFRAIKARAAENVR